ncbi:uncharacterized protein LOC134267494 [Saccostrea cucullata]|uniref:uncharacterized protein LOC134267494 n=1 Tax=Saccostrea cuccullata TaxID=36930 RepID=UPI002ED00D06
MCRDDRITSDEANFQQPSFHNQGLLIGLIICGILVITLTVIVIVQAIHNMKTNKRMQCLADTIHNLTGNLDPVATTSRSNTEYYTLNPEQAYDLPERQYDKISNAFEMQSSETNSESLTRNSEIVATTNPSNSAYTTLNQEQTNDQHEHYYKELANISAFPST